MTDSDDRATRPAAPATPDADADAAGATDTRDGAPETPHPPFARTPDEYTDPPGHHRRGPHGPALDVGA